MKAYGARSDGSRWRTMARDGAWHTCGIMKLYGAAWCSTAHGFIVARVWTARAHRPRRALSPRAAPRPKVTTRLLIASCPGATLAIAGLLLPGVSQPRATWWTCAYITAFNVVGTLLHVNFLPWT